MGTKIVQHNIFGATAGITIRTVFAIGRFLYDAVAALGAAWVGEERYNKKTFGQSVRTPAAREPRNRF